MPGPIEIAVGDSGDAMAVSVTFPDMSKQDLIDILATFFANGPNGTRSNKPEVLEEFKGLIGKASNLTMTLTTRPGVRR
jgi:hypothetical protein